MYSKVSKKKNVMLSKWILFVFHLNFQHYMTQWNTLSLIKFPWLFLNYIFDFLLSLTTPLGTFEHPLPLLVLFLSYIL